MRRLLSSTILILAALVVLVSQVAVHSQERDGRLSPPTRMKCDRNDLTVYDGRVLTYRRRNGSTFLRIRTNFDTTETVTIRHPGTDNPTDFYLLNGEPFRRSDLSKIENKKTSLKPGMRANVWLCRGNPTIQPIVDWKPDD